MAASPATPSLAERAEEGDGGTEWFYVDGAGVRRGPHNFRVVRAQLRCGVLDGDDLVWREGLPAWRPAAEIPVFASCVAGRAGAAAESVPARDDASPPERDDAATPDRARESAPVAAETRTRRDEALELDVLSRPRRDEREPTRENLSACWHASRSDGARFGPVDAETLVRLLAEAEAEASARDAGEVAETLVWHPAESAAWGPVEACPSLAAILALRRREARASRSSPETAKDALAPPASPHGVARRAAEAGGEPENRKPKENRNGVARQTTTVFAKSVESPRRVLALEAELAETREALGSARFEIDALEAELASTRERAAEATAFAREAARAAEATEDLSAARVELETKTAELSRLRGVLKGKLLARVLAEMDDTRERVVELDELDARDAREGAW